MSEALAVVETTQPTALTPKTPADLELSALQSYLTSWQQGGSQIVTFSAKGIFHIADELRISVTESHVKETSDGSGYYFTATAENPHTGRTFVAHVYQSATRYFD